ncbi:MAG: hypothetical protein XU15_C0011G0147 [candidate division NC10 bacterium CSP1-5]|nr:MAG: hypothetical protein XU15_C0011G0003 [candidate division NC10 bacterium CSP1-5]KRT69465.1 MAG: hypothetical protein XU15_C0011G0147 [candidate division NC10 bacterium CSP1-5]
MTRIFTEGFEAGDTLFWGVAGNGSVSTTTPRSGSRCWQSGGTAAQKSISAISEGYVRLGLFATGIAAQVIMRWYASGTELGSLRLSSAGNLQLYTSTGTLVATGSVAIQLNTWYLVEVRIKIADAGGVLEVKVDGTVDATFSGDTKPGADTTFNLIYILHTGASVWRIDDFALNDTAGGVDDGYPGDGKVVMLTPNGNGDSSQLVGNDGNSVDNYLLVDEIPSDSDTTYVESATATEKDLYGMTTYTLESGQTVLRLWVEARARELTAAGDGIQLGVKSGATESFSATRPIGTSYARYVGDDLKTDPNTAAAWTQGGLDALQAGVKVA